MQRLSLSLLNILPDILHSIPLGSGRHQVYDSGLILIHIDVFFMLLHIITGQRWRTEPQTRVLLSYLTQRKPVLRVSGGSRRYSIYTRWFFFFLFQLTCTGATIQIRIEDSEVPKRTLHLSVAGKFQGLIDCFYQRGSLTSGTINNGKALAELWTFLCVQLLLWLTSEHVSHHQDNKVFNRKGTAAPPRGAAWATIGNSYKWINQRSSHSP